MLGRAMDAVIDSLQSSVAISEIAPVQALSLSATSRPNLFQGRSLRLWNKEYNQQGTKNANDTVPGESTCHPQLFIQEEEMYM